MRYKKCKCGEIILFNETEPAPKKCSVCMLDLGYESFFYDEEKMKNETKLGEEKSILYLEDKYNDYTIDIPNGVREEIIGRAGLGPKDASWGLNISRKHLIISVIDDNKKIMIRDSSTNGTKLNGYKVDYNTPMIVDVGDVIVLDAILNSVTLELKRRG